MQKDGKFTEHEQQTRPSSYANSKTNGTPNEPEGASTTSQESRILPRAQRCASPPRARRPAQRPRQNQQTNENGRRVSTKPMRKFWGKHAQGSKLLRCIRAHTTCRKPGRHATQRLSPFISRMCTSIVWYKLWSWNSTACPKMCSTLMEEYFQMMQECFG